MRGIRDGRAGIGAAADRPRCPGGPAPRCPVDEAPALDYS